MLRKGVEVNMWNLEQCTKIWTAKAVYFLILLCTFVQSSLHISRVFFDILSKHFDFIQPKKNSLGIFAPTWFTSATFLSKDDHRKFAAGTSSHQVIHISFSW